MKRVDTAVRYWRVASAIAGSHLFGMTWPPPGRAQRSRVVGHWGANPGIAWVVGHLASNWDRPNPLLLMLGTGHATSFIVAHEALRQDWSSEKISAAAGRYGQPGGDPSELIGWPPGTPLVSGELGPAVAISQAVALNNRDRLVVCVIGDGECEAPATLAGLAHRAVLFGDTPVSWLPVVNANGARMGGPARFESSKLARLLEGMGYEVLMSDDNAERSSEVAGRALAKSQMGLPIVWLSVTKKGWPAPDPFLGKPFRGAAAHKPPTATDPTDQGIGPNLSSWLADLAAGALGPNHLIDGDILALARKVTFELPPIGDNEKANRQKRRESSKASLEWVPPVTGLDNVAARECMAVFSPDEAHSNRLINCLSAETVVEVLSEETCFAWALGSAEAGRPAVFASYEAFAPLIATQIAQYAKLVHHRRERRTPAVIVALTSLSWANCPTHQNTDIVGTVIARPFPRLRLLYPIGATSAERRLESLLDLRDGLGVIICSKQKLPDIPDPGGAVLEIRITGSGAPDATIVAAGDVGVAEAVAAMVLAASRGLTIRTIAVVDVTAIDNDRSGSLKPLLGREAALGVVPCAPRLVQGLFWEACGRVFPIHGYREQFGATPWDTLRRNGMDRFSLLTALLGPASSTKETALLDLGGRDEATTADRSIPSFEIPEISVRVLR